MNTSQPIRKQEDLDKFKNYYVEKKRNPRNASLLIVGLNTALRISDILLLKWKDVYNDKEETFLEHICIIEQKTKKTSKIYMNDSIKQSLETYRAYLKESGAIDGERYLFENRKGNAISRIQAYRLIKQAADYCQIEGVISPHSLRKTFGYQAWKHGVSVPLLMKIFNHSSFEITMRYLGIEQDDRDEVFKNICI